MISKRWLPVLPVLLGLFLASCCSAVEPLRIGVIGLDTSHATAFTREINRDTPSDPALESMRVVAAYPQGSEDIESSVSRVPEYTAQMQDMGVAIVDTIPALLDQVDCVLLVSNDGRVHLSQAIEVFRRRIPVFIDKPLGGNLAEVLAIFRAAEHFKTPMFSASSLRFGVPVQRVRAGEFGAVLGCNSFSPCALEPTHVDLFWYGIHGVELLYTSMGVGCKAVSHTSSADSELSVGLWNDGRIGTFRGIRGGKSDYGGTAFCEQSIEPIGPYQGYLPLLVEVAKFFRTHESPIAASETIELYAFMQAAQLSKERGGVPVELLEVMQTAEALSLTMLPDSFQ